MITLLNAVRDLVNDYSELFESIDFENNDSIKKFTDTKFIINKKNISKHNRYESSCYCFW